MTKPKIRSFLRDTARLRDVADDETIFGTGLLNSLFAVQLVLFVEKEFHIEVGDDDLELDNFRSINDIAALVERKRETK